jgi:hypothetical protein
VSVQFTPTKIQDFAQHVMVGNISQVQKEKHTLMITKNKALKSLNNYRFNFGLTIASKAFPKNTKAKPVIAIINPGGTIHHHNPRAAAP